MTIHKEGDILDNTDINVGKTFKYNERLSDYNR